MARRSVPTGLWFDEIRGLPIDAAELQRLRRRAHDVYLRNGHIFEDEADALAALGAVPQLAAEGGGWSRVGRRLAGLAQTVLELLLRLTQVAGQLRQLGSAEDQQHDGEDDEPFGTGRHVRCSDVAAARMVLLTSPNL